MCDNDVLLRAILISVFFIIPDLQYFMTAIWSWLKKQNKKTIPVIHQPELSYHGRNKRRAFLTPCSSAALLSSGLCWRHALMVREMMMRIRAMRSVHVNKHTHCCVRAPQTIMMQKRHRLTSRSAAGCEWMFIQTANRPPPSTSPLRRALLVAGG